MKFILGTKQDMTQVFAADGRVVPVTRVKAGACVVTQVKTKDHDRVAAVQIGAGTQKKFRLPKAQQGHLRDIATVRFMKDVRVDESVALKRGDRFTVKVFVPGDRVQVVGQSKGKGFQGVVKRHGFHGGPASHGHKDNLRMPGSIGAGGVQRVFKNMRMGGHMGDRRVTVKNLEVVQVHPETDELWIKGALPGARGSLILVSTSAGSIEVEPTTTPAAGIPAIEEPKTAVVASESITVPESIPETIT